MPEIWMPRHIHLFAPLRSYFAGGGSQQADEGSVKATYITEMSGRSRTAPVVDAGSILRSLSLLSFEQLVRRE